MLCVIKLLTLFVIKQGWFKKGKIMNTYDIKARLGKVASSHKNSTYGEILMSTESINGRITRNSAHNCLAIQDNNFKLMILAECSEGQFFSSIYLGPMF